MATGGIPFTDRQRIAWLRLIRSENIGPATFIDLINHFGSAADALDALPDFSARARRGRPIRVMGEGDAVRELERIAAASAQLVCMGEPNYPGALRAADGAPPVLTVRGNTNALTENAVAFVGSRNASLAGVKLTGSFAGDIGEAGFVVVSGLARGIDSAAHKAALKSGTIAVFAGGIDHIYPRENASLADAIVDHGGALVTEMPFGWTPRARDFPRRNRIIAGMALGLVVVEAAKRSGSLISARLANEMGRTVFAVPGSPLDPRSSGTNHLIRQGATLVTCAADILEGIVPMAPQAGLDKAALSEPGDERVALETPAESDRALLVSALSRAPTDIDELLRHTGLKPGVLQMLILEMDLAGEIERHTGNRISLV